MRGPRQHPRRWRTPAPPPWCCTRCSRSRSTWRARTWTASWTTATESFAEALTYFPDMADYNLGPEGYLEHIRKAKEAVGIPVIASLNGTSAGGWVALRQADRGGRRRRPRAEHLLPADRPGRDRRGRSRSGTATWCDRSRRASASRWRSSSGPSSAPWPTWPGGWTRRARTPWCCSTASTSRTSTWKRWRSCPTLTLSTPHELLLRLHWVADPLRPRPGRPGGHRRRPHGHGRAQGHDGGRHGSP